MNVPPGQLFKRPELIKIRFRLFFAIYEGLLYWQAQKINCQILKFTQNENY